MQNEKPKIIVVVAPTASGKTALSIKIAKKINGEIISADSRQVYKNLDIGTEKVTMEEMGGVPHYLIDVVDVNTVYNASDYKKDASHAISEIISQNHTPIIAGGTFFYIDTLLEKIGSPEVAPNPELREKLEKTHAEGLYEALLKLDPRRAEEIDPQNKRRIIRALEIVHSIGVVPKPEIIESPYEALIIGIKTDKKELRTRIRERAEQALTRGLVEETRKLLADGVPTARLMEIGLEYRLVLEYLDDKITGEELIQKIEEKNWQYAKRQMTWLKRDESIQWFELSEQDIILQKVKKFLGV